MQFGLSFNTLIKIRKSLNDFQNVESAIIYGSRAMGNFRKGSDIDLALNGTISFDLMHKIAFALDELMLPYKIDIAVFQSLENPKLIEHINVHGQTFYERDKYATEKVS